MTKFYPALALFCLTVGSASAAAVTYSTSGTQLCIGANGCGTSQVTFGNTIITYIPVGTATTGSTVSPTTNINLGDLIVSCLGGGLACSNTVPANLTLYLNINQIAPPGMGQISGGTIAGAFTGSSSTALISWAAGASTSINAGGFSTTYAILSNPLQLAPPSNNNCGTGCSVQGPAGATTIQGIVSQVSTTPEPGSILLLSTGLAGFLLARKRLS